MEISKEDLKKIINEALDERNKPSAEERKKQIMSIKDARQRQQAIAENMDLFRR